jgi:copper chaperone NosL
MRRPALAAVRALGFACAALAACGRAPAELTPAEIAWGVDVCERCHMVIDDPDRAAQWVEPSGVARKFDEPGDLVAWLAEAGRGAEGRAFVGDFAGTGWVAAEAASFVRGAVTTAMGHDVIAFRDGSRADSLAAARGGRVVDWPTLLREGVSDDVTH